MIRVCVHLLEYQASVNSPFVLGNMAAQKHAITKLVFVLIYKLEKYEFSDLLGCHEGSTSQV